MKKLKTILFLTALACALQNSHAQGLICVTSSGTTTLYTNLDSAIIAAPPGAFIYLSGSNFFINRFDTINKPLNFVGAGYWPDSTLVTGKTFIFNGTANALYITDGADQSTFTGIDFSITVINAINHTAFTNINFSRCIFNVSDNFNVNANSPFPSNVFKFSECIFNTVVNSAEGNPVPCTFDRCLFYYLPNSIATSTYTHCSFYNPPGHLGPGASVFTNCALLGCQIATWRGNGSLGCFFNNCIISDDSTAVSSTGLITNCICSVSPSLFYANVVGSVFLYTNNYQLISGSPGHLFATDGTDVGIYGSAFPFKAGGVPYNPHFSSGTLPPSTDSNGNLNITLTVGAQSR